MKMPNVGTRGVYSSMSSDMVKLGKKKKKLI